MGAGRRKGAIRSEVPFECEEHPLSVEGRMPEWLTGTLVRNGPVTVEVAGKKPAHWFDGLGMLHAFSFAKGRVSYSNRFLRSAAYQEVFEKGSLNYQGFAQDPCRSLFSRFFTHFFSSPKSYLQNANVNVAKWADQYVALTETPLPVCFDPETLETLGVYDYKDSHPKKECFESAHPHYDASKKEILNYFVRYGKKSSYCPYLMREGTQERRLIAEIPVENPSYMHTFSVTPRYLIFVQYPFVVKPIDFLLKGKPFIHNFHWHKERETEFLVIDREKGEISGKYTAPAFFSFHHVNAYEEGDEIVLDLIAYPDPAIIEEIADFAAWRDKTSYPETRLVRFRLHPQNGLSSEVILETSLEFPRIHAELDGKKHRYAYVVDARPASAIDQRDLSKIDMDTGKVVSWSEWGCEPGEPVFIPSPQAKDEDEGILLSLILNYAEERSFLLVLDAQTFKERGRAVAPHPIPSGLHGQFFKEET